MFLLFALACNSTPSAPGEILSSDLDRELNPDDSNVVELCLDNAGFGLDLFGRVRGDDNLFTSPFSISTALAMTYAGAQGSTEAAMADALAFRLPEDQLHEAFNALALALDERSELDADTDGEGFQLSVVNQLFGQTGYGFESDFLDVLAVNYGAAVRLMDFQADPDGSREAINTWVEEVTNERIEDLLPAGSITSDTKLVLANAIYFKASWSAPFDAAETTTDPFVRLDGSEVSVPTMHAVQQIPYGSGDGYEIVQLPYVGEALDMTLLVPEAGRFEEVVGALDGDALAAALGSMGSSEVTLGVPKWSFRTELELVAPLTAMGMGDAFDPAVADFSGMSTESALFIGGIFHQAFVDVNEEGTEAAAATAVVMTDTSVPDQVELEIDRPFVFMVRDRPTGAVLFLGQVLDPGTTQSE